MSKPTSAMVLSLLGNVLLVRNQQSTFNAIIGSSLPADQVRQGDIVALTWQGDVAYAMARLGNQSIAQKSAQELATPPVTPKSLAWNGEKLTWIWNGRATDLSYFVVDAVAASIVDPDVPQRSIKGYPIVCYQPEHVLATSIVAYFRVKAVGSKGTSSVWSEWSARMADTTPPKPPRDITWTPKEMAVDLSWQLVEDASLAAVEVYVRTGGDIIRAYTYGPSTTSCTIGFNVASEVEVNLRTRDYAGNYSAYAFEADEWLIVSPYEPPSTFPSNGDFRLGSGDLPDHWVLTYRGASPGYPGDIPVPPNLTWYKSGGPGSLPYLEYVSQSSGANGATLRWADRVGSKLRVPFAWPVSHLFSYQLTGYFYTPNGVVPDVLVKIYLSQGRDDTPQLAYSGYLFNDYWKEAYANSVNWYSHSFEFRVSESNIQVYGACLTCEFGISVDSGAGRIGIANLQVAQKQTLVVTASADSMPVVSSNDAAFWLRNQFAQVSWASLAIYERFWDENERVSPEATYPAAMNPVYGCWNGSDTVPNREFIWTSVYFPSIGDVLSATADDVGVYEEGGAFIGYIEDADGDWFEDKFRHYEVIDGFGQIFEIVASTESPRRLLVDGNPQPGVYRIRFKLPAYSMVSCLYEDASTDGYGTVKLEATFDGGANWDTYVDTATGQSKLDGAVAIQHPGRSYGFRLTLRNDSQGRGPKVAGLMICTDPAVWT